MTQKIKYQIRRGCPNDFGFIQQNWLESWRADAEASGDTQVHDMAAGDWMRWAQARVMFILTTTAHRDEIGDVVVRVAHKPGDDEDSVNALVGFVVAVPASNVLHYVYVAPEYRGVGMARDLLSEVFSKNALAAEIRVTHLTGDAKARLGKLQLRYLPL